MSSKVKEIKTEEIITEETMEELSNNKGDEDEQQQIGELHKTES